MDVNKSQPNK